MFMNKKNLLISFFLLALSCAVHPPLTPETARGSILALANSPAVDSMQGSGRVDFGQNGEQVTVSFDVRWAGDSSFSAQFSTQLGMTVASVKSAASGTWIIEAGDSEYTVRPGETIRIGTEFLSYPVTWHEFLLIMTGRMPCADAFSSAPDSQYIDRNDSVLVWKSRRCGQLSIDISGKIDNKTGSLSEVLYNGAAKGGWTLTAAGFKNGRAKEFRFVQSNNNYFYVKYHSMKFHSATGKRKAF